MYIRSRECTTLFCTLYAAGATQAGTVDIQQWQQAHTILTFRVPIQFCFVFRSGFDLVRYELVIFGCFYFWQIAKQTTNQSQFNEVFDKSGVFEFGGVCFWIFFLQFFLKYMRRATTTRGEKNDCIVSLTCRRGYCCCFCSRVLVVFNLATSDRMRLCYSKSNT